MSSKTIIFAETLGKAWALGYERGTWDLDNIPVEVLEELRAILRSADYLDIISLTGFMQDFCGDFNECIRNGNRFVYDDFLEKWKGQVK